MSRLLPITIAALGLALLAATGCERQGTSASGAAPADVSMIAVDQSAPLPTTVGFEVLAPLARQRPTMLAAMLDGSIYVVQSPPTTDVAEDAQAGRGDVLMIPPDGHAVQATGLTADAVIRALNLDPQPAGGGVPATRPSVVGQFTAIAARGDGKLAFAFGGIADKRPFFAVGTFDPAAPAGSADALFLPVDHLTIAGAGDTDVATDAARQNLFTAGDDVWLWRATDREMRLIAVHNLSDDPKLTTRRLALDHVRDASVASDLTHPGPDQIERSGWEWTATPERGHFLLTDRASRWIRRIDENGDVTHVARFEAQALATLSAAAQDAAGRVLVLGCDRDGIAQALLVQDGEQFKSLPAANFLVPVQLPASRLQIDRLLAVPKQPNVFVAYDGISGSVVRVTLK